MVAMDAARGPSLFGNFVEGNYLEMLFLD
jgi:hypothetical protein